MLKQVIIMRTDLNMDKGKAIGQGARASRWAMEAADPKVAEEWRVQPEHRPLIGNDQSILEYNLEKTAVLKAKSFEELKFILDNAEAAGLPTSGLVRDAGLTQIPAGTVTCIAIGPADEKEINKVTGSLKLL